MPPASMGVNILALGLSPKNPNNTPGGFFANPIINPSTSPASVLEDDLDIHFGDLSPHAGAGPSDRRAAQSPRRARHEKTQRQQVVSAAACPSPSSMSQNALQELINARIKGGASTRQQAPPPRGGLPPRAHQQQRRVFDIGPPPPRGATRS